MPLPVITEAIINSNKQQAKHKLPWYHSFFKNRIKVNKPLLWRNIYGLASITTVAALIYILTTFKTLKEYQILTAIVGVLFTGYVWLKRVNIRG